MNQQERISNFTLEALGAVTCIALLSACDPAIEPESERAEQITEANWVDLDAPIASPDHVEESAPVIAELAVGDGKIIFYDETSVRDGVEDVVVGMGFIGESTLGAVVAFDEQEATPLEIFLAVAPEAEVPEVLEKEHDLQVEAGRAEPQPRDSLDLRVTRESYQKSCPSWQTWMSEIWPSTYTWSEWTSGYMPSGQSEASGAYWAVALYFYTDYSSARALGGCNHGLNVGPNGKFQVHYRVNANDSWHQVAYYDLSLNEGYYYRSSGSTRQYRGWVYHPGGESTNWYINAAW
ncbi:hypothetical protein [Paraliomyxa miuraensis]|uniref:hypothetical protein n=1 Tax=Paraliomyxa miuraensis TaxID=376150 RepID=UPI00225BCCC7|nr:hypothetical protein [Paraliomyxa miuraensis]MCX4240024.1 hypothetical protein [Paraliomyxa miuraensis]